MPTPTSLELDHESAPTFAELGVPGTIAAALADDGKRTAFPIQTDTLPDSLAGRDVLGRGRTGSGKTLAFAIPLVARLGEMADEGVARGGGRAGRLPHPQGLVLAPTRELANQINDVLAPLAHAYGMDTCTVYGGVKQNRQVAELNAGARIVVACPGRLEDLLRQGLLTLDAVDVVVLDEADEMADMGFLPAVERLLEQVPDGAQHMLFSATLDHGVDQLVDRFLHDPKTHSVDSATSPVDGMTHHVLEIAKGDKPEIVRRLAAGQGRRILFTRTKYGAKKLAKSLTKQGIPAAQLHGNLNQNQRDRNLNAFESGEVNVLVATDVAARGIDVSGVGLVVQVEPPEDPKSFLHRSGRTARAGQAGDVVTLVLPEHRRETMRMLRQAGIKAKPVKVRPDSPEVDELAGEEAEKVEGWELAPIEASRPAPGTGRNRSRRQRQRAAKARRERLADGGARAEGWSKPDAEGRVIDDPDAARGGRRVHRKPIRVTEDLRGEDAKRHDRRVAARQDDGKGRGHRHDGGRSAGQAGQRHNRTAAGFKRRRKGGGRAPFRTPR
ncbi:DEAD/DEAH box helicase [Bifidobacterium pullorum subsp. saeculare]|uniref:DEAD/DEAH box helicase n=1 Tax=Bifidobacterium pullorum subsp. saeculare TaxID=78257 RepID=A0A938WZ14_9BIFI|nr:DEAD/DEAH box helicase [Bifidobacterium pullorum]MBM6699252.1 DEAD/DEAH box helicase [Bifidobacterium pullorum subsp. saeculare]